MLSSCVCLSVCRKPVLHRNDWTNPAGVWHGGFLPSIPFCVSTGSTHLLTYFFNDNKPALSNTETGTRARRPFLADTQKVTLLGLLDMSAAFDTVDHKILLERLEVSFGVKGLALAWLSSFLVDRTQVVAFGGNKSTSRRLLYGVPQGSVLGPLLFALYSADVIRIAAKHGVCIHAYVDGRPADLHQLRRI